MLLARVKFAGQQSLLNDGLDESKLTSSYGCPANVTVCRGLSQRLSSTVDHAFRMHQTSETDVVVGTSMEIQNGAKLSCTSRNVVAHLARGGGGGGGD